MPLPRPPRLRWSAARPRRTRAAWAVVLAALLGAVLASPFGVERVSELEGHVSATYDGSWVIGDDVAFGGREGVLRGLSFGGALGFEVGETRVDLRASDVNLARQGLELSVEAPDARTSLSWDNVPPATPDDERSTDLRLRQSLNLPNAPRANAAASWRKRGDRPASSTLRASLSDSYRSVAPGLEGLRWRGGYRFGSSPHGTAGTRYTHALQLRLDGEVDAREDGVVMRPGGAVDLRWETGAERRFRHRYDLSLDAESEDGAESLGLNVDLRMDSERPTRGSQSLSYANARLEPVTLQAEVSRDQRDEDADADYRLGVAYDVSDAVNLSGGYHGQVRDRVASSGAEASLQARFGTRPWRVTGRTDADVQIRADGRVVPSARASLSARYGGDVLSASVRGNLRHDPERTRGRLELSADLERDPLFASAAAGLRLARELAAHASLDARTVVAGAWSLQGRARYRADFDEDADHVVTLGMGLRYDFGGE